MVLWYARKAQEVQLGLHYRAGSCKKMENFRTSGAEILRSGTDRWNPQIRKIMGNSVQRRETAGSSKGKGVPCYPAFPAAAGSLFGLYAADEHAFRARGAAWIILTRWRTVQEKRSLWQNIIISVVSLKRLYRSQNCTNLPRCGISLFCLLDLCLCKFICGPDSTRPICSDRD